MYGNGMDVTEMDVIWIKMMTSWKIYKIKTLQLWAFPVYSWTGTL